MANPDVKAYAGTRVFQFWAAQGIDGFRIDHMMDDLDNKHVMTGLLANFWTPIEVAVRRGHPNMFFIGEQSDWGSEQQVQDIFTKTPTDALFAFPLKQALLSFDKPKIMAALATMSKVVPKNHTEFTFLENHDTERFASAEPDPRKQRLAAALLLLLKGTPSIYYGQELGMKGVQGHWGNDGNDIPVRLGYRWGATLADKRTPHWYSGTGPWANPVYSKDHDGISVAEEAGLPSSMLNCYRKLIHFRLSHPALRVGSQEVFHDNDAHLLSFRREAGKESILVFANLGGEEIIVPRGSIKPNVDLFSGARHRESIHLGPYGFAVIRAVR